MNLLLTSLDMMSRSPQEMPYYTQVVTYGLPFWAGRKRQHAAWQVYFTLRLVHVGVGLLHHWPHG